jgi:6-phosphofructokinase 1
MKTLFVVSGGDAPGINALLGHYARQAAAGGDTLIGAVGGFPGLLAGDLTPLTLDSLIPWVGRGGSILPSSRDPVLSSAEAVPRIQSLLHDHAIDNMVLFGGNGTLRHIPPLLTDWGLKWVGIPTTIDNDVPGTERTLGFDSACNYAYQAIDGAMTTAHALRGRLFMVETLGGFCGNLALAIAYGAGAHAVLLPEFAYEDAWLAGRMKAAVEQHGYGLIVLNEEARGARTLAQTLPEATGIRMRDVRLGHAQRGGVTSHLDRTLAAELAAEAYHTLKQGSGSGTLIVRGGRVALQTGVLPTVKIVPDKTLYNHINDLGD